MENHCYTDSCCFTQWFSIIINLNWLDLLSTDTVLLKLTTLPALHFVSNGEKYLAISLLLVWEETNTILLNSCQSCGNRNFFVNTCFHPPLLANTGSTCRTTNFTRNYTGSNPGPSYCLTIVLTIET